MTENMITNIEGTVNETETSQETFAENQGTVDTPPEPVIGFVTDCKKLNIRKKPVVNNNNVVVVVEAGTELLIIDPEKAEGKEWYKVLAPNAVEGFCMKKYVTIEE